MALVKFLFVCYSLGAYIVLYTACSIEEHAPNAYSV